MENLSSTVSHELKTPISTSMQFLQFVLDMIVQCSIQPLIKKQIMKYLEMINFAMTMNLHFINNLMDLKMINEGAFETEM